ncbi:beta-1 adrenergic receptor-like [Ruditapes philippinarum]|uniref:beta-1 adrenergic receptor-like n=1 Tax=Ruditapes philippinarum TaxID=129788 RepID=UPI00295BF371|nr:beta-1 adrenergic receptor-like [Ruditapes philippinarum]
MALFPANNTSLVLEEYITNTTLSFQINENLVVLLPHSLVYFYHFCVTYVTFIIWIIAFPSNILIIIILTKKKQISSSTCVYFLSLACGDLCVNFRTLNFWLVRSKLVTYTTDFECQIEKGYPLLGMLASSWTLATISSERMLCVAIPYKMKDVCTTTLARAVVIVIWSISLIIAIMNGWFYRRGITACDLKYDHRDIFINHIAYLDYFLDVVIPFFIILVNSVITLIRLRYWKTNTHTGPNAFGKSVTVLVLCVNTIFFITQVPYGIVFLVQRATADSASELRMLYLHYLEGILLVLKYVNYSVNFYIYFLTASKFRKETRDVLLLCKNRVLTLCSRSKCCQQ